MVFCHQQPLYLQGFILVGDIWGDAARGDSTNSVINFHPPSVGFIDLFVKVRPLEK